MNINYFPACCNIKVITHFGGTNNCDYDWQGKTAGYDSIINYLNMALDLLSMSGEAMAVAATNDAQTDANRALSDFGFHSTPWTAKAKEHETEVKLWWLPIHEWEARNV